MKHSKCLTSAYFVACSILSSCSGQLNDMEKKDSNSETSSENPTKDASENGDGTDEPAWVNAASLTLDCTSSEQNQDLGTYSFVCQILTDAKKIVSPEKFSTDYKWSVKGAADSDVTFKKVEAKKGSDYTVTITLGTSNYITPDQLRRMTVAFNFNDKTSNKPMVLQTRLDGIFSSISNQKYFRLVIAGIKDHAPLVPVEFVNKIEVKLNGSWKELSIDENTSLLKIDNGLVESNGTLDDSALFANIVGALDPPRRASDFERFKNAASKFTADEPLILTFGTGTPQAVTGLRYNGGLPLVGKNIAAGFPAVFHMEASVDKTSWTLIPGSSFDIDKVEDAAVLQFLWTGK